MTEERLALAEQAFESGDYQSARELFGQLDQELAGTGSKPDETGSEELSEKRLRAICGCLRASVVLEDETAVEQCCSELQRLWPNADAVRVHVALASFFLGRFYTDVEQLRQMLSDSDLLRKTFEEFHRHYTIEKKNLLRKMESQAETLEDDEVKRICLEGLQRQHCEVSNLRQEVVSLTGLTNQLRQGFSRVDSCAQDLMLLKLGSDDLRTQIAEQWSRLSSLEKEVRFLQDKESSVEVGDFNKEHNAKLEENESLKDETIQLHRELLGSMKAELAYTKARLLEKEVSLDDYRQQMSRLQAQIDQKKESQQTQSEPDEMQLANTEVLATKPSPSPNVKRPLSPVARQLNRDQPLDDEDENMVFVIVHEEEHDETEPDSLITPSSNQNTPICHLTDSVLSDIHSH